MNMALLMMTCATVLPLATSEWRDELQEEIFALSVQKQSMHCLQMSVMIAVTIEML